MSVVSRQLMKRPSRLLEPPGIPQTTDNCQLTSDKSEHAHQRHGNPAAETMVDIAPFLTGALVVVPAIREQFPLCLVTDWVGRWINRAENHFRVRRASRKVRQIDVPERSRRPDPLRQVAQ